MKYYNVTQQRVHQQLLSTIRRRISIKNTAATAFRRDNIGSSSEEGEGVGLFRAGDIVLYGVCLQRQSLDPSHDPRDLGRGAARNARRPYLHRFTGFSHL